MTKMFYGNTDSALFEEFIEETVWKMARAKIGIDHGQYINPSHGTGEAYV